MQDTDVVVVGGGIVGLCSALALQRQGRRTLLIDRESADPPASWGNAGHIAIEQAEPIASLATLRSALRRLTIFGGPLGLPPSQIRHWAPFAWRLAQASHPRRFEHGRQALSGLLAGAMPAWRRLAQDLPGSDLIRENGHMVVWFAADAARRGVEAWQRADVGTARFRPAIPAEIELVARATGKTPAGAITFTNTGQVTDPGTTLSLLRQSLAEAGGQFRAGHVAQLSPSGQGFDLHLNDGTSIAAPRVLVASGARSGALLAPFGLNVPIIAERGYHIQAENHRWPEDLPPVVFEEQSMIATRFSGGLRLASFVEFGAIDAPPTPRHWSTLERRAKALNIGLDVPITRWTGARPTLPDYLPAIGRATGLPNLFYAFGHQHLGLTLGPVTGEIVAAMVNGSDPRIDLRPFGLERFSARQRGL